MTIVERVLVIVAGVGIISGIAFAPSPFSPAGVAINQYEHAQRQTVLIQASSGQGSGVIISRRTPGGQVRLFVWTAAHVVGDDAEVSVKVGLRTEGHKSGSSVFKAQVINVSKETDVALLRLNAPASFFEPSEFDTAAPLRVGDAVFHVGNFFGDAFDGSVTTGIISQVGIHPDSGRYEGWPWKLLDQTSAFAVPGSSGGPVFSGSTRRVVGLIVGGPLVGGNIACFLPVRVIEAYARTAKIEWAVRGTKCPADSTFEK
jgi:S1-C subfamily serine protease